MLTRDLVQLFVGPLDREGLEYAVTGSVASMLYGEPRFTNDVDVVLRLKPEEIGKLRSIFGGPDYYCPDAEVIRSEAARESGGHVNLIHSLTGLKADLYFAGNDSLKAWALRNRRRIDTGSGVVEVVPPEYVVLSKLLWYHEGGSAKHVRDIRSVIAVQGEALDLDEIRRRAEALGLADLWREVLER